MRVVRSVLSLSLVFTVAVASGCVSGPPLRTAPEQADTGAPLEVRSQRVDNYTHYRNLGIRLKDGTQSEVFTGFYQGSNAILDEIDFYAIAKDQESVATISAWREKYNTALYASYAAQTVGVLVVASGIGVGAYGFSVDPDNIGNSPFYGAALGLVIGGSIIVGGSPSMLYSLLGPEGELDRQLETTPLLLSWATAAERAAAFNRAREGGGGAAEETPTEGTEP